MVFAVPPVIVGDELGFYYGAFTGHHAVADSDQSISIGLGKLRRDGFVSLDAGEQAGAVTTATIVLPAGQLHVNADVKGGSMRVALLDETGEPIPDFAESQSISTDTTDTVISWGGSDLGQLRDQPVKLRFTIDNGRLYSYWVE
jgi:hypothetical protein